MIYQKFVRFLVLDRPLQMRFLACGVCLVILVIQLRISGAQSRQLAALKAQKSLIAQIPVMERMIRANTVITSEQNGQIVPLKYKLEGITVTDGVPYALIDGIVYAEGDTVGIYQVEKLLMNEMTLKNSETQETKILHVLEELNEEADK